MLKIEPDRLLKEELEYEISIRGITPQGTNKDLIKTLRELIILENEGHSFKTEYTFKSADELVICEEKLREIERILAEETTNSWVRKLKSKLSHILGRIERIVPSGKEETESKSKLLTLALKYLTDFKSKQESLQQKSSESDLPIDLAFQQSILNKSQGTSTPKQSSSRENNDESQVTEKFSTLHIDHHKLKIDTWGLKFSGKSDSLSLNAFFERIDEICEARSISKQQLFKICAELFEGEARVYYRAIKHKAHDWESLCNLFREEFFRDGNKKIWEQIKARTQGHTESIAIYVAYMLNLFDRLSVSVNESIKLEIIRERIRPEYQNKLDLVEDITSLDHLIKLGRRIEDTNRNITHFVPPTIDKNSIEVDLQYKEDKPQIKKKLDNIHLDKQVTFESNRSNDHSDTYLKDSSRSNSRDSRLGRQSRENSVDKNRGNSRDKFVNRDNFNFNRYDRDSSYENRHRYENNNRFRDNSRNREKYFDRNSENNRFRNESRDRYYNRSSERNNRSSDKYNRYNSRDRDTNFNSLRNNSRDRFHRDFSINRPSYSQDNRNSGHNTHDSRFQTHRDSRFDNFYTRSENGSRNVDVKPIVCYKCNGLNHKAQHCTVKSIKCYTCGLVGYTRNNCVRCKPQGNAHRDQI